MKFSSIEDALEAFGQGEFVIVSDNEDRENEGDLIIAAEHATEENMAFLLKYSTGIICVPMIGERLDALNLPQMTDQNDDAYSTAFTVTVDVKEGITTGVSASDRAKTIRALADTDMGERDFRRPGHIFPLRARPGGTLMRAGHTEAAVDLAVLSGCEPAAAICEMMNEKGVMMKRDELAKFSEEHDIPFITISQLIEYRRSREVLIERIATDLVETRYGRYTAVQYLCPIDDTRHMAFVKGEVNPDVPTPVRVHRSRGVLDMIGYNSSLVKDTFDIAMNAVAQSESGIVVALAETRNFQRDASAFPSELDVIRHRKEKAQTVQRSWKETGIGAQIIRDLGARKLKVIASDRHIYSGIQSYGLEIVEQVSLEDFASGVGLRRESPSG